MVILAAAGWLLYRQFAAGPAPQATLPRASTTTTPESFTNFIGRVASVEGQTMMVRFSFVDRNGRVVPRTYEVSVAGSTSLQRVTDASGDGAVANASLSDFRPNDAIQVFADDNLHDAQRITATRILKLQ